ncbi:MAG: hypothetical protein QOJ21_1366 [Solirubrobacteraceae bacterium]|jgi:hypothetical protein|nr:hypothetical protein [Solirubrobacteraceae bacterium]
MGREAPPPAGPADPGEEAELDRPEAEVAARNETDLERLDRNLVELLQEVRVVQTGVQVLFAFLLTVPFSARYDVISGFERGAYFTALVGATAASILLIAPTAVHRILFRLGQKAYMVDLSNRLALGGLVSTAVAMIAVMLLVCDVIFGTPAAIVIAALTTVAFVGVWAAVPLRRRRQVVELRSGRRTRRPRGE